MAAEGAEFTVFTNCENSRHFEAKYNQEPAVLLEVSHYQSPRETDQTEGAI